MTYCELKAWSAKHQLTDIWWIAVDGRTLPAASDLAYALEIKCEKPDAEVAVMNADARRMGVVQWTYLQLAEFAVRC